MLKKKKEHKPGKWRWLSCKVNDTVFITYVRSFVILLTKMKALFKFYTKEGHNHSYEKIKPAYMSVLPVSTDMEISSKEQILHLDSSRSVKGSPAKHQSCSTVSGLDVMMSFVTTSFKG